MSPSAHTPYCTCGQRTTFRTQFPSSVWVFRLSCWTCLLPSEPSYWTSHVSLKGRVKTKQNSARGFECGCDFSLETVQLINVSFPLTDTFIHQARLGAVLTPAPPQGTDTELLNLIHQY